MTTTPFPAPATREQVPQQEPEDPGTRSSWQQPAACREASTDLFFPIGTTETRQARQICAGCPVRQECLAYAQTTGQQYGIWGGHDEQERRLLRHQQVLHTRRPAAAGGARGHPPARLDGS
jgi:WhiB family transcriptional regulator, redox-sensing transcriptional regulator